MPPYATGDSPGFGLPPGCPAPLGVGPGEGLAIAAASQRTADHGREPQDMLLHPALRLRSICFPDQV